MKKILCLLSIMLILTISTFVFADNTSNIIDGEQPPSEADILLDQQRMDELAKARESGTTRSYDESYYLSLSVTAFEQENDYYCGPATVKQTIHYIEGTSDSQDTYATNMGTENGVGTYVDDVKTELNDQQSTRTYVTTTISTLGQMEARVESAMRAGVPAVLHIKGSTSLGWPYNNSSGHFVNGSGLDYYYWTSTNFRSEVKVTDCWTPALGSTWYDTDTVKDVCVNRLGLVIY